jgi:phosphoribosyl-ATP pyrophosphohydrolase/phosphoribosyl-AMP cyclohydrolase
MTGQNIVNKLNFDEKGLIPAVIQDAATGEVLMLGYMNETSLKKTLATGEAWFYSRSRKKLWHKGETSGNVIKVVKIWQDCENNSLLVKGHPTGPVCHTGHKNCFFTEFSKDDL